MIITTSRFFRACVDQGLGKALAMYENSNLKYYSGEVHRNMVKGYKNCGYKY